MESLTERIRILERQGYVDSFVVSNGHLHTGHGAALVNEFINLDATYRIEDASDPNNQSIVFAITCKNPNSKGLLINSFGLYSDTKIDNFIQKIRNLKKA